MKNASYTIDEKKTARSIKKTYKRLQFKRKMKKFGQWISDNRDMVVILGPAVIALSATIITKSTNLIMAGVKQINMRTEKNLKEHYCYDRSLGHYWKLRRELTNREWVEIDKRRRSGERMADILNELRVLK